MIASKSRKQIAVILITALAVLLFMTLQADNVNAASKTKKMTVYTSVLKSGETVYCCSTKGLSEVDLETGEVTLMEDAEWYGYCGYTDMKKKGHYLYYFFEGSSAISTTLYRTDLNTGKTQKLAEGTFDGKAPYVTSYAISGNKLYVSGYYMGKDKPWKRVMKLNGKSKKKTSVRAKNKEKKSNCTGYKVVEYGDIEEYETVDCYLMTPQGDRFFLGEAEPESYDDDEYYK